MDLHQNGTGGLPDILFPTEGEKSSGNEAVPKALRNGKLDPIMKDE